MPPAQLYPRTMYSKASLKVWTCSKGQYLEANTPSPKLDCQIGISSKDTRRSTFKFIQRGNATYDKVLLLFDGHMSHVSHGIIRWAREKNVMMVLPPHGYRALQPLDVGCCEPSKGCYYNECIHFMAQHSNQVITRYDMAKPSGKAHFFEDIDTNKHCISIEEVRSCAP